MIDNNNSSNSSKINEDFEQWLRDEPSSFKDLNTDEVFIAIVNTTLIILVLFILPIIILLWQASLNARQLSFGIRVPEITIQYLFNKQEYGRIKYV